ncbi:major histocompatibility complex class I-related gene protein-like isoform X2 [Anguilla rostrata]|uniref:major histocompatibility complex class I-related gene protein-like isoform X2 n=1 Tax=Anguilla rostrata TaxID=7938 RepID=UPI0030D3569B
MRGLVLSIMFCGLRGAFAVTHSWKAFYTASTGLSEFPQFVAVNIVDDEPVGYFDSRTSSFQYRQKWMEENLGPEYLKQQTDVLKGHIPSFKANVGILMESFNQSGGVHTFQWMFGCEWDDETGATGGFSQYGYDGEDFITYDMENQRCVALAQSGFSIAQKKNNDPARLEHWKYCLTQECVDGLKKYVSYGRSALERTVAPKVSLLQKDSPSPGLTCHVTGFYPRGFMVTWQRNGEDLYEDVELGETVPNGDGTFQTRSHLSVKPEDWKSQEYTCTVQHKSLEQDIVLSVKEENIKRNSDIKSSPPMGIIIACVLGALILILAIIGGVVIWKKRSSGYKTTNTFDTGSEGSDRPAVKA